MPPRAHGSNAPRYGSDVVASTLRDAGIPYVALNPGASFRGLHDSLVNFLGNRDPEILLCLHEEHAVAIAHGYAKVTGRPMAAAVHSNVGLMHATMAIFNAWCDRMPVLVLGATGPVDAARRRPWIDWIHTAADQGALVRPYVKWDDQPGSPAAARESVLRAVSMSVTPPRGPTYINLPTEVQEGELAAPETGPAPERYLCPLESGARPATLRAAGQMLLRAESPVVLVGRVSRSELAWQDRVSLVEFLGARVVTDMRVAAAFPNGHPAHAGDLRGRRAEEARAALAGADAILALDWVDLNGTLTSTGAEAVPSVIRVTLDPHGHNGWSMDHQGHPPADLAIGEDPDAFVADLLETLDHPGATPPIPAPVSGTVPELAGDLSVERIAAELRRVLNGAPATLTHVTLGWDEAIWPFQEPLDYLGGDGGGGIGAGPGLAVGAALALRDAGSRRLPVAVCGDGDFLMGATALWTAVHHRIPLLMIVANNASYYNDEVHQESVARMRGRDPANKGVGIRIDEPAIDLAGLARTQGCVGFGPVTEPDALGAILMKAVAAVRGGAVAVVEVATDAGYGRAQVAAVTGANIG